MAPPYTAPTGTKFALPVLQNGTGDSGGDSLTFSKAPGYTVITSNNNQIAADVFSQPQDIGQRNPWVSASYTYDDVGAYVGNNGSGYVDLNGGGTKAGEYIEISCPTTTTLKAISLLSETGNKISVFSLLGYDTLSSQYTLLINSMEYESISTGYVSLANNTTAYNAYRLVIESVVGQQGPVGATLNMLNLFDAAPPPAGGLACFAQGTRVLTQGGYKAVEDLEVTDRIQTSDGRVVPFTRMKTSLSTTTKQSAPYLIEAGAFGPQQPSASIRLSPTHKILLSDNLWTSPERAALTNPLVTQEEEGKPVDYYHVECPSYKKDNMVSEGLVVEPFGLRQVRARFIWNEGLGGFRRFIKDTTVANKK